MTTIPSTIDQIDADWVADATGLGVTAVRSEIIGVGIGVSSAVYRLHLEGTDVPDTMVLKLHALDPAAVFTSSMLHMYEREVKFFDDLAGRSPIRVPCGYGGALSEDGATYYLLMQDVGGHRCVDQNLGMELADAERSVDALASWHAEFWGDTDRYIASGAAMSLSNDIYKAVLPLVFGEGLAKLQAETQVHPTIAGVAPRWVDKLPNMLSALSGTPTTIAHGDYRADNIFFDDNNEVVLLDFQLTGCASPGYDLAYFVTQSLLPEVASANERQLFDRYIAALLGRGVPEAETARLWEDYRTAALFCLVYPVVASRGMDLTDQRQLDLITNMNLRCARAIDELSLSDLL